MRTIRNLFKIILLQLLFLGCNINIYAYDFVVDGIYYNKLSDTEVEITKSALGSYSGEIDIPSIVTSSGDTYAVVAIGRAAFENSSELIGITISNSVKTIGDFCFYGCTNLEYVKLPNSLEVISKSMFQFCQNLKQITLSQSITTINESAFSGCSNLADIILSNSLEAIGSDAFKNCSSLTEIILPNSLTTIGGTAFSGSGLTKILLPAKISSMGAKAFDPTVKEVESEIMEPFSTQAFLAWDGMHHDRILYVPIGTKEKYVNCFGWGNYFKEIIEKSVTYSLNIIASGNGSATYGTTMIRNNTQSFTVDDGVSVIVSFSPDNGFRIKSVKVNNVDVTSSVSNNTYTISSITKDTSVEVVFEAITHTLSIKATGNGSATYDGTSVRGKTSTFTVNEGTSATITFNPDEGNRIKSLKVNNTDVTSSVTNNSYIISSITEDTSVEVVFEAITHTLSIKATGNGSATYSGSSVRAKTSTFTVNEGTSATITFTPDKGYRIKSVKVNNTDITSSITNNAYTINSIVEDTFVEVVFEVISHTLSIKATGNGSATYSGTTVRATTSTFTVNDGASATITFTPDEGYRIKSLKVNNTDVTSSVTNNAYIISSISEDVSVEVVFEATPTYTLKITSTGNGSASYNGSAVRAKTSSFTVYEGASVTVVFTPDNGYRIANVKVNDQDVTAGVNNSRYTISSITANTTMSVSFEEIPPTTYSLSITATGNGSVTYSNTTLKNKTQSFTVTEGSYATIAISPESGYRIKSVVQNGADVTTSVDNNQYTTNKITGNTTLEVTFESIPITIYTLSVTASGNGTVNCLNKTIKNQTESFDIEEGLSVTVTFSPDNGNSVDKVKVNGIDVTSQASGNRYVIESMSGNTTIEVSFKEDVNAMTVAGVNYTVTSQNEKTIVVAGGNYGKVLIVPATISQNGTTWKVVGIEEGALNNNTELAAVIWNPEVAFTGSISNPNLLLYVKDERYAPTTIQNVIVNGTANSIVLTDAGSGNNFYCPQAFTVQHISYTHNYQMQTGVDEVKGWETIALPFAVQTISHEVKGAIKPFEAWNGGDSEKPFWLYELTGSGFVAANSIQAYTPYIISMPNNPQYDSEWLLNGNVIFAASSVTIEKTEDVQKPSYKDRTFVPCFETMGAGEGLYALNVRNQYETNNSGMPDGSMFVLNMRKVHPFEAYLTTSSAARQFAISIFDGMTTDIPMIESVKMLSKDTTYDLQGRKITHTSKKGVYIVNGKKIIK